MESLMSLNKIYFVDQFILVILASKGFDRTFLMVLLIIFNLLDPSLLTRLDTRRAMSRLGLGSLRSLPLGQDLNLSSFSSVEDQRSRLLISQDFSQGGCPISNPE
jgi:hypothetical protein